MEVERIRRRRLERLTRRPASDSGVSFSAKKFLKNASRFSLGQQHESSRCKCSVCAWSSTRRASFSAQFEQSAASRFRFAQTGLTLQDQKREPGNCKKQEPGNCKSKIKSKSLTRIGRFNLCRCYKFFRAPDSGAREILCLHARIISTQ